MKNTMRKLICGALVCMLLLVLMPVAALAADTKTNNVTAWNLVLADEIAVNFYVDLSDDLPENAAMKVTDGKGSVTYPIKDAVKTEDGRYIFTAHLAAAQLADEIKLEVMSGSVVIGEQTYCALDYAKFILNGQYHNATKALMRSMLHYGAAAQTYFGYNTDNLANDSIEAAEDIAVPQWDEGAIVSGEIPGVWFYGASLVFDSRVAVRFYFDAESVEGISFGDYEVTEKNGKYCVEVPGINPQNYDDTITLQLSDGENEMSVSYSPMTYIARQYAKSSNEALRALVQSMYAYHLAAEDYLDAAGSSNISGSVVTDSNGIVTEQVILKDALSTAVIAAGTQLEENTDVLTLSVVPMEATGSDVEVGENEQLVSMDVHVEGVAAGNTVPVLVTLNELAPEFLNKGNISLYHVENGATVEMTRVYSAEELDAHNEYYYDIATGTVTVALASFSEVVVTSTLPVWKGNRDYSWYDASKSELTIYNADQLAGFSAIVGGMAKDENDNPIIPGEDDVPGRDSFAGKTVTLMADIDLGDAEANNDANKIFYPIGYYNTDYTYEKTKKAITSGLRTFEGTFDGNGHTIANFYHNTWEMKGDHDWYAPEDQYYRDGMGLFGRVYGGTVKNLTVKNFSSDGEIATTGVIAAYADFGATFENITIFDCNPRVYNIGNGGIVGCVGWYTKGETKDKVTFRNITVDNSNKISALWGSYDVACGGIVGQYYPTSGQSSAGYPVNAGISMENCHVAAQMDVYNDVCANYQYYAYRYAGILIGSVRENETIDGRVYPKMDGIEAKDCTVHYGDWNDYYYCELVANTTASYTHDHQMSRLEQVASVDVEKMKVTSLKGVTTAIPTSGRVNYVVVNAKKDNGEWNHATENATCYHFKDGEVWKHEDAGTDTGIDENGDGQDDLKEDKQHLYLEFNNLITGYGWGVTSKGVEDMAGVEILDRKEGSSVKKFDAVVESGKEFTTGTEVSIGNLFKAAEGVDDPIDSANVEVFVSPADENSTVSGTYVPGETWDKGTLTFTGTGAAIITITDYNFCIATELTVQISEVKFEIIENEQQYEKTEETLSTPIVEFFAPAEGAQINSENVTVTVEGGTYTANTSDWTQGTIVFDTAGEHTITITDNDNCVVATQTVVVNEDKFDGLEPILQTGKEVYLGDIFKEANHITLDIDSSKVQVAVEGATVLAKRSLTEEFSLGNGITIRYNESDWTQSVVKFTQILDSVTFTITDGNYCIPETLTTKVEKGVAVYTGEAVVLNAVYGQKLSEIELPEYFTWEDATQSVGNAGTNTFNALYNPDANNYENATVAVTIIVAKANAVAPTVNTLTATYGDTLEDITLPTGFTWAVDATTSVGNAGEKTFSALYNPDADNYYSVAVQLTVNVAKADPKVDAPTGLTATYGDTLADVALTNGWVWQDATTTPVGNAGTNHFTAVYTPDDTDNYNTVEVSVSVEVAKANSTCTAPTAEDLIYTGSAQALVAAGSTDGGTMVYSVNDGEYSETIPTATDAGTYTVYYKVKGDANHNDSAVGSIQVTIAKATPTYTVPTGLTAGVGQKLEDVTLPDGWAWKDATQSVGDADSKTFAATYTPTDTNNYNSVEVLVTVEVKTNIEKFVTVFEHTDTFLYRVGNQNTVALSSLFKALGDVEISSNVTVSFEGTATATYTANSDWKQGTIKFSGTGPVAVTITDNDYCIPYTLHLEVVTAKNIATATMEHATSNSVVLLNNVSGGFSVSGGYTVYGNDFTITLPTTVQSGYSAGFVGYATMSGGNLDNVRVVGPVYPEMYIYREQAKDSSDPTKANYFYNSILINGGNNTISNSYISGSRTAISIRGGNNVTIENTTVSGGAYANIQIAGASSVTLKDLTTVQTDVKDSYGKNKTMHGLGIAVDSSVVDIYIEGVLNQHNWLCEEQWNAHVPSEYQSSFPDFFGNDKYSNYWHYLNSGTDPYVNLTFIFACNWDTSKIHDNRTTVDYKTCDSTIAGVAGGVYSKVNTIGGNAITDSNLADPGYASPGFNPVAPVFTFDNTVNYDEDDATNAADTYCVYDEGNDILKIGVTGASKTVDLSGVSIKKDGTALSYTAYLNGTQISSNSVTIKASDGAKQTLTFKVTSNDAGYDKDGKPIQGSIEYTWNITIEMAVLAYPAPVWNMGGDYQFDTSNCYYVYYSESQGYGEAVPIYEGIKISYYNKSGTLVNLDLSGTATLPTGSANSNANAFTYTLADGSVLTMKFASGWKSGATTHQFTAYKNKVYIYPQSLDNDNYVRAKTTNQDFNVKITYNFTDPNGLSTGEQTMQWYNAKASNGSVSKVQWKTFDSTGKKPSTCVTPDTLITLADGTQKRIDQATYEDLFLVWDFVKGEYTAVPGSIVMNHGYGNYIIAALTFDDGTTVKAINGHGFFHTGSNKYVILDENNAQDYIGESFVKMDGDSYSTVKLESVSVTEEYTESWSILTVEHYNCILEGMFTLTPAEVEGSPEYLMPFAVGEDMKYDEAAMQADIENYGLYTYEDFADYMTCEQFEALNLAIWKVSVGKGYITYEDIIYLAELHLG